MTFPFRRYLRWLHRWTGLTVGLVITLIALAGIGLVFRRQLEPIVDQKLFSVPACQGRVSLDTLTANARAAYPSGKFDYVRIFDRPDNAARIPTTLIRFTDQEFVYLNPCNGDVVGIRGRYAGLFGIIETIHRLRFLPGSSVITGSCVLAFALVLTIGGLILWWPAVRRGWRHALSHDRGLPQPARRLRLHRTAGAYIALIVLTSALTGLPQSFEWYRNGLYRLAGSPPPAHARESTAPADSPLLPMEQVWQKVQALVPRPAEALLHYAQTPRDALDIYVIGRDAPHPNARTLVTLDAHSGAVLSFTPYAQSSPGHKLYFWTLSIHTGYAGWLGQVLLLLGVLGIPVMAWTGLRSYLQMRRLSVDARLRRVRVVSKKTEARDICTFELADPSGRALPAFSAGAHIDVHVNADIVRQYSLCNDPRESHRYLIGVLRVPESRGGSRSLHEEIEEGDLIDIGEPRNHFPLTHSARRTLLLAAGIGITPILCMAERLANIGSDFRLHYWARSRERAAFVERIERSSFMSQVAFHFSDGPSERRGDIRALLANPDPGTHLYVCGPVRFMDDVLVTARRMGWPDDNVHREYFGAAVRDQANDSEFAVRIASSGKSYRVARGTTVLEVLSAHGIVIPRSCEQGVCGTCVTGVLEGVPDHRDRVLSSAERARNDRFTPCCSRALSEQLVLDL
jgi:vanillate O-demethylase ferredoxin subunit